MVIINTTPAIQPAAVNRPAGPAPILPADRLLMAVVLGQKAGWAIRAWLETKHEG